jgi:hypothetical protein
MMTDPTAPAFPRERIFVVQLAPAQENLDLFRGRVEHLASGQVARFESLARLREFVEQAVEGEPRER